MNRWCRVRIVRCTPQMYYRYLIPRPSIEYFVLLDIMLSRNNSRKTKRLFFSPRRRKKNRIFHRTFYCIIGTSGYRILSVYRGKRFTFNNNNKTCVQDARTAGRRNTITVRSDYRAETFANQNTQYIVVIRYGCVQFAREFTIPYSIERNRCIKEVFLLDRSDKDTMGNALQITSQRYFYFITF